MTDDDYDALSQKQLASIKRDMRISLEDAAVRATYKVMAELETEQEPVKLQYPQKDIDWQREQQIKAQASIPPQRKPLSDEEMKKIWYAMQNIMGWYSFQEIARAIEAAHGIKE